jgi:cysteinyl-tRNA synthetase
VIEHDVGGILGIGLQGSTKGLASLARIRGSLREADTGTTLLSPDRIEALIAERNAAKAKKDFARADTIRQELLNAGIEIKDGPAGTTWRQR